MLLIQCNRTKVFYITLMGGKYMYQIFLLILSIALLVILITKLHVHPFFSLLLISLAVGVASGLNLADVSTMVASGFGGTMQNIGIVIICGVIIGEILEQ